MSRRWIYFAFQFLLGMFMNMLRLVNFLTFRRLLFRVKIEGGENLRGLRGPLIMVCNHKTYFDPLFGIVAAMRYNLCLLPSSGIGADWLFAMPVVGWMLKNLGGAYPARKGQGIEVSLKEMFQDLDAKRVVGLFPEGGIRYHPGVHEVQRGAAYLALKSGAPVMPIAIRGIEYFSWKSFFFERRTITIVFGKLFFIFPNQDLKEVSAKIRGEIDKLYRGA